MTRLLGGSWGGRSFLMGEVPLYRGYSRIRTRTGSWESAMPQAATLLQDPREVRILSRESQICMQLARCWAHNLATTDCIACRAEIPVGHCPRNAPTQGALSLQLPLSFPRQSPPIPLSPPTCLAVLSHPSHFHPTPFPTNFPVNKPSQQVFLSSPQISH